MFRVQNNKIVEFRDSAGPNPLGGKLTYHVEINEDTGLVSGHFLEKGRWIVGSNKPADMRWGINGVFIDRYFAGELIIYWTHQNGKKIRNRKWASYVFESP